MVATSPALAFGICFLASTLGLATSSPTGAQPAARRSEQTTALANHLEILTCLIVGLLRNFDFITNSDPARQGSALPKLAKREPIQIVIIYFVLPKATDFSLCVFN
jgi:hypothetical protein